MQHAWQAEVSSQCYWAPWHQETQASVWSSWSGRGCWCACTPHQCCDSTHSPALQWSPWEAEQSPSHQWRWSLATGTQSPCPKESSCKKLRRLSYCDGTCKISLSTFGWNSSWFVWADMWISSLANVNPAKCSYYFIVKSNIQTIRSHLSKFDTFETNLCLSVFWHLDMWLVETLYLLINSDRSNDHLLCLFSFHVVQAQWVNLGSQVSSHLITNTIIKLSLFIQRHSPPDRTWWSPALPDVHQWSLHLVLLLPSPAKLRPGRQEQSHLDLLCCPEKGAPGMLLP